MAKHSMQALEADQIKFESNRGMYALPSPPGTRRAAIRRIMRLAAELVDVAPPPRGYPASAPSPAPAGRHQQQQLASAPSSSVAGGNGRARILANAAAVATGKSSCRVHTIPLTRREVSELRAAGPRRFAQDFKKNNRQLFSGGAIDKDWVYVDKVNDSKWNHMNYAAAIGSERNYVHLWMIDERSKAAVQIERAVSFKESAASATERPHGPSPPHHRISRCRPSAGCCAHSSRAALTA
jgi:hypothetical protein